MIKTIGHLLFKWLGLTSDPIVGLDISSSGIKLLELSCKGGQYRVEHYAIEPLQPDSVVGKVIKNKEDVIATIKKVVKKSQVFSKQICTSVPNSLAITRTIQLNAELTDKEIGNEIELEADKYIPYAIDEVNLDYETLNPSKDNEQLIDVLLAVSKTENIDTIVEVLSEAGLKARIIDIDSFAMERAFKLIAKQLPEKANEKIIALVDIGYTMITLNIFKNFKIIYTKEQSFGGQYLINEIRNRYGLSIEEAILAKKSGDLPDDYNSEILESFKKIVIQQINHACQFFFSSVEHTGIDYMVLTGGTSAIPGLDSLVQQMLKIKTFFANPFLEMNVSSHIDQGKLMNDANVLMGCCGLALRNFTGK